MNNALSWFAISKDNGGVHLLVGVFDPRPDAVKAFVGCPKDQPAIISKPYGTPEEADKEMRKTMEAMGIGESWHPGPLDRMAQLPDITP